MLILSIRCTNLTCVVIKGYQYHSACIEMFRIFGVGNETKNVLIRLLSMILKPLYRSDNRILVGLMKDFQELCVLDGLVVEVDLSNGTSVSSPAGGISLLKKGSYIPIRQHEKAEYSKIISKMRMTQKKTA